MTLSLDRFYPLVIVLIICHCGFGCNDDQVPDDAAGSTVSIEVSPESINELITDEINITCTPKDLPQGTKKIVFMELGKEGEHPLVALQGPTLELGTDMKTNMQASGQISENVNESFLQLTIKRPFVDDVNVYCCRMFYQNEFGELKMGHVYADLPIENNDKAVFIHLLKTVSDLQSNLLKQQNYTKDLEKTIKEQKKQLVDRDRKVSLRFDEVEDAGRNQSDLIQDIMDRDSFNSAFSVYGTKAETFNVGETLVFKNFLLNVGNHYDMSTGVFTAPRRGLYVFHLFVRTYNDDVWIHLKVNGDDMAMLYGWDSGSHDQSSVSTVVSLKQGDRVWPHFAYGARFYNPNDKNTVFNGYLLKLL